MLYSFFSQTSNNYTTADLLRDINQYFLKPMSTSNKILAVCLFIGVIAMLSFLLYKTLRLIWKKDDNKNDKKLL